MPQRLMAEIAQRMDEIIAGNIIDGSNGRLDPVLVFNLSQSDKAGHEL